MLADVAKAVSIYILVMHLEPESKIIVVLDDKGLLAAEIISVSRVDDSKVTLLERRVLQIDTKKEQMRELHNMYRANTSFTEEVGPILLGVLVVDTILEVERKEVLNLNRSGETDAHVRVDAVILLVGASTR